jgi:pyocin large subunit-like protein
MQLPQEENMSTTMPVMRATLLVAAGVAALALAACDNGPSAVARKQAAGTQMATNAAPSAYANSPSASDETPQVDHRREPVKLVGGKPMWSASRKSSANENAQRAFDRNGAAFGARDIESFVGKAHAFVDHPPKGTLTMTRKNGDTLFYDPKGNIFAVASKEGAPRTMFKPDDGMAYWEQQKSRETRRQASRRNRDDDA